MSVRVTGTKNMTIWLDHADTERPIAAISYGSNRIPAEELDVIASEWLRYRRYGIMPGETATDVRL